MGIGTEPVQESSDVASDEVVDDSGVDAEEEREEEGSWRDSLRDSLRIMLLLWVGLPVTVLFWSVACGAILAAVEDWPFKDGFFFMGATMSTAVGLTARSPESEGGRFFVTIAFAWGLGIFAFCSAILATPIAAPIIRIFGLHTSGFEDELHETKKKSAALKLGFLVFICFPALLFLIGVILGGVICGFEDEWDYYDGFGYTLSILSGYVNVSSKHPRTAGGKIIGLLVGSWGLGGYAVAVSVIGCPFVAPLLNSFVKKNKKAFA